MSGQELSTVKGPDMGSNPGNDMLLPLRLSTTTDKFKWRKKVTLYVTTVNSVRGEATREQKEILSALKLTFYSIFDHIFASHIEQYIAAGIISLDGDDDETENQKKQLNLVSEIVKLVGKNSQTYGIRGLVQVMRQVFNCVRENGKARGLFARRFQALALDYLKHYEPATIQQDIQNLQCCYSRMRR